MKQCPKCNFTCNDDDIICKNCGYLFTPAGFNIDEPSNNQNAVPPQSGSNNPYGTPPQNGFNNPNGAPPQNGSDNQYGTPPQNGFNNPNGVPLQDNLNNPNGLPPQGDLNNWQNQSYNTQNPAVEEPRTNGFSIASLVLGIIGVVFSCCYGFGIIPAIVSLVFGIISMKKVKNSEGTQKGSGMSLAGIILAAVGILISICVLVIVARVVMDPEFIQKFREIYRQYNGSSSSPF